MWNYLQASSSKDSKPLAAWTKDIVRHFWKSAEVANGSAEAFKVTVIL